MVWTQISARIQGGMKSYTWRTLFRTTHNHPRTNDLQEWCGLT